MLGDQRQHRRSGVVSEKSRFSRFMVTKDWPFLTELRVAHGEFLLAATAQNLQLQLIVQEQAHANEEQTRTGRAAKHRGTDGLNPVHCDTDRGMDHSPNASGRAPDFPCVGIGRDDGE
jgi:hypothetical protein